MIRTIVKFFKSIIPIAFVVSYQLHANAWDIENIDLSKYGLNKKVYDIVHDNRGLIYFAEEGQLVEIDANSMREIKIKGAGTIKRVRRSPEGKVYFAGERMIGYLIPDRDGIMQPVSYLDRVSNLPPACLQSFFDLSVSGSNAVFACNQGLVLVKADKVDFYSSQGFINGLFSYEEKIFAIDDALGLYELDLKSDVLTPKIVSGGKDIRIYRSFVWRDKKLVLLAIKGRGLYFYKPESNTYIKMPVTNAIWNKTISSLSAYRDFIVVGTEDSGIFILNEQGDLIDILTEDSGLMDTKIIASHLDSSLTIWAGTDKGVSKVIGLIPSKKKPKEVAPPFSAIIREVISTKDNAIIFGGAFFNPKNATQTLTWSEFNYKTLPYTQNALRFSMSNNNLSESIGMEYRTILEGFESTWSEWSTRANREYTNLIWNDYVFKVQAKKKDGSTSVVTEYKFSIKPPWYESNWFYLGQFLFLFLLFLVSAYAREAGYSDSITKRTTGIFMSLLMGSIYGKLGVTSIMGGVSNQMGIFKLFLSALMGLFLKPIEGKVEYFVTNFKLGLNKKKTD